MAWCSKSPWDPPIRREHHLVREALPDNHAVAFIERPMDVRSTWSTGIGPFVHQLAGQEKPLPNRVGALRVVSRTTLLPGHLDRWAARLDSLLLARILRSVGGMDAVGIGQSPWQWSALASYPGRKVFDYSDDWARLLPDTRKKQLEEHLRRIAAEADEIIVVSPHLRDHFPGRTVHLVPNGSDEACIASTPAPPPGTSRLVYIGTLSERFDAELMRKVLESLPHWRLDLYGDCQYAHCGTQPDDSLQALLVDFGGRVAWHGRVAKSEVPGIVDSADVCVIPNRSQQAIGQSSMKLYDFAGRGRPIVATPDVADIAEWQPPGYYQALTVEEWVDAITVAATEPRHLSSERLAWTAQRTWRHRWTEWSSVTFS
jgi:glycosyltransferase involved in cell wall biosynthesis